MNGAEAGGCEAAEAPRVEVIADPGVVRVDDGKTLDDIAAMASDSPEMPGGDGVWRRIGLTQATFEMTSQASLELSRLRGGDGYCVRVRGLTLALGFSQLVIFVPEAYARSSCAYGAILDHESQHVAAHRQTLEQFEAVFRREARQAVEGLSPFRAASQADAEERLSRALTKHLERALSDFRHAQRAANRALDTAERYHAIQAQCRDW